MLDRQQLESLLSNRFPGASAEQIAAAANAIMAMIRAAGISADEANPAQKSRGRRAASPLPLPLP
jgi:hypothetical protein